MSIWFLIICFVSRSTFCFIISIFFFLFNEILFIHMRCVVVLYLTSCAPLTPYMLISRKIYLYCFFLLHSYILLTRFYFIHFMIIHFRSETPNFMIHFLLASICARCEWRTKNIVINTLMIEYSTLKKKF